jgi:hypothetical protein
VDQFIPVGDDAVMAGHVVVAGVLIIVVVEAPAPIGGLLSFH